jgi:hypothetical protein
VIKKDPTALSLGSPLSSEPINNIGRWFRGCYSTESSSTLLRLDCQEIYPEDAKPFMEHCSVREQKRYLSNSRMRSVVLGIGISERIDVQHCNLQSYAGRN